MTRGPELAFDPVTGHLTGWFMLSYTINPEFNEKNPEPTEVNLVYDAEAGRLSGTFAHPESTFELDLETEKVPREFFDDPSCYPVPTDKPVEEGNPPATP